MTEYIRQLDETGLKMLGVVMNTLNSIHTNEPETQHKVVVCALDIETILKEHIYSLDYDVKL